MQQEMLVYQEAARQLKRLRELENQIEEEATQLARWKGKVAHIANLLSVLPDSGRESLLEEAEAQSLIIEARLRKHIAELGQKREQQQLDIEKVEDYRLRTLLKYRYLEQMTFEEIAEVMHYSWRWIMKLHKLALEKYWEVLYAEAWN